MSKFNLPPPSPSRYALSASSTVYVLMISLLISGLMGAFIWMNFLQQSLLNRLYAQELARENLRSGRLLFLSQKGPAEHYAAMQLFQSPRDSCYIHSEQWGALGLLHATGVHGQARISESCLVGQQLMAPRSASLLLYDHKQPLRIVGRTRLEGKLLLPPAGLQPGHIGRKSYQGDSLFYGSRASSRGLHLPIDTTHLGSLLQLLRLVHADTSLNERYYLRNMEVEQAWDDTTWYVRTRGQLILRNAALKGKLLLLSSGEILVEPSARPEHLILIAKRIRIKAKVRGCLQAFATEALIVEEKVKLSYPSVLMLTRFEGQPGRLQIGPNSTVEGAVLYDTQIFSASRHRLDYCLIARGAEIWGLLEAQHNLDLRGKVMGHVVTHNFLLRTPSAIYRNYLLDAYISARPLHPTFNGPLIQAGKGFRIIDLTTHKE